MYLFLKNNYVYIIVDILYEFIAYFNFSCYFLMLTASSLAFTSRSSRKVSFYGPSYCNILNSAHVWTFKADLLYNILRFHSLFQSFNKVLLIYSRISLLLSFLISTILEFLLFSILVRILFYVLILIKEL